MDQDQFRTAAEEWIASFDAQAHNAVSELRKGGDRLGGFARERWDRAFAESSPQLSEETQRNASHARDVFARWYGKGVEVSLDGQRIAESADTAGLYLSAAKLKPAETARAAAEGAVLGAFRSDVWKTHKKNGAPVPIEVEDFQAYIDVDDKGNYLIQQVKLEAARVALR